jgi:hypothetical protein
MFNVAQNSEVRILYEIEEFSMNGKVCAKVAIKPINAEMIGKIIINKYVNIIFI